MTDGILLKEIETDLLLKHYSVIIIDEAHERSLNSDILVSLLTRIAHARCELAFKERKEWAAAHRGSPSESEEPTSFRYFPLRLVVMSATLRVEDFQNNERLFPPSMAAKPNCIKVSARQYPVTTYYSKVTKNDYCEAAYRKVKKIHETLPAGGILVFLTGKKEINYLCQRLKIDLNKEPEDEVSENEMKEDGDENKVKTPAQAQSKVLILPLYSQLSPERQYRVFQAPKDENVRVIVIATNVAETSLTIPNIRYVVDSGRSKEKLYDTKLQISKFAV